MSVWAHVNGSIRIDGCDHSDKKKIEIANEIGGILNLRDSDYLKAPILWGSETKIQYSISTVTPDDNHATAFTVNIWGDIRYCEDTVEIEKWFKRILGKFWIRQAILQVDCITQTILVYDGELDNGEIKVYKLER